MKVLRPVGTLWLNEICDAIPAIEVILAFDGEIVVDHYINGKDNPRFTFKGTNGEGSSVTVFMKFSPDMIYKVVVYRNLPSTARFHSANYMGGIDSLVHVLTGREHPTMMSYVPEEMLKELEMIAARFGFHSMARKKINKKHAL
jgi:hypothetical protein